MYVSFRETEIATETDRKIIFKFDGRKYDFTGTEQGLYSNEYLGQIHQLYTTDCILYSKYVNECYEKNYVSLLNENAKRNSFKTNVRMLLVNQKDMTKMTMPMAS